MLVKFLVNRGNGSIRATADYLLGKNRDRQAAFVLSGDIDETIRLTESLTFKHKYTAGVLSFAESDLEHQTKQDIMDEFERCVFAGLDRDQYNITWIQHQDKDRLELNFVIPKVELSSGKSYNPYYDRTDRKLVNSYKNYINAKYELDDPNDPSRKQIYAIDKRLPKDKKELQQAIADYLATKIENNLINDRDDIITTLEQDLNLTIARTTKTSISIKDPNGGKNIRLKGGIYEQSFVIDPKNQRTKSELAAEYRESITDRQATTAAEYRAELERRTQYNRGKYPRISEQAKAADQARTASNHSRDDTRDFFVGNRQDNTAEVRRLSASDYADSNSDKRDAEQDARHRHTARMDAAGDQAASTRAAEPSIDAISSVFSVIDDATAASTTGDRTEPTRATQSDISPVSSVFGGFDPVSESDDWLSESDRQNAREHQTTSRINRLIARIDELASDDRTGDNTHHSISIGTASMASHHHGNHGSGQVVYGDNAHRTPNRNSSRHDLHHSQKNPSVRGKNENILQRFSRVIASIRTGVAAAIRAIKSRISEYANEIERIDARNSKNTKRIARLTSRIDATERRITNAECASAAADRQIDDAKSAIATADKRINQLARARSGQPAKIIESINSRVTAVATANDNATRANQQIDDCIAAAKLRVEQRQQQEHKRQQERSYSSPSPF